VTFIGNYNANPKLSADEKTLVMIHRQDGFTNFKCGGAGFAARKRENPHR
jgi:hypothetical protein